MSSRPCLFAAVLGSVLLLAACDRAPGPDGAAAAEAAPAANEVVVHAHDYRFDAPEQIPAGLTTFRLVNHGPELHHIWLVRLEEGRTVQDMVSALQAEGPPPSWMVSFGGPNTPTPDGAESLAAVVLEAGDYAMICVIPSDDGTPHIAKGMVKPLTVTPNAEGVMTLPEPDVVMTLDDYDFELSQPITAGRRTIRVDNNGPQEHEVIIVQLASGKTLEDMITWLHGMEGPPPGRPVGGTTGKAQGLSNLVTLDFEPGEYALLCMVPDAGDGQPHVAHGMVKQITVM